MYLIDGITTWQGNFETGGQDQGGNPVSYDPTLKKLTFTPPLSNLTWAGSGAPTETFNSVTGIPLDGYLDSGQPACPESGRHLERLCSVRAARHSIGIGFPSSRI